MRPGSLAHRPIRIANRERHQHGQSIVVTFRPVKFTRDVLAFSKAGFGQAMAERGNVCRPLCGRRAREKPDHRNRRLLRTRSERHREEATRNAADERSPKTYMISR